MITFFSFFVCCFFNITWSAQFQTSSTFISFTLSISWHWFILSTFLNHRRRNDSSTMIFFYYYIEKKNPQKEHWNHYEDEPFLLLSMMTKWQKNLFPAVKNHLGEDWWLRMHIISHLVHKAEQKKTNRKQIKLGRNDSGRINNKTHKI